MHLTKQTVTLIGIVFFFIIVGTMVIQSGSSTEETHLSLTKADKNAPFVDPRKNPASSAQHREISLLLEQIRDGVSINREGLTKDELMLLDTIYFQSFEINADHQIQFLALPLKERAELMLLMINLANDTLDPTEITQDQMMILNQLMSIMDKQQNHKGENIKTETRKVFKEYDYIAGDMQ